MAEKKNQHYVPKAHLRNFSTDTKRKQINIWLHESDRIVHGASIRDQCSKSYFYGKDLEIENFFNSPEGLLGNVVRKLDKTRLPQKEDMEALLFLWLLQNLRAEKAIMEHLLIAEKMREKVALGQEDNEKLDQLVGPPIGTPEAMKMALENAREYYSVISDLRCVLLINDTKTGFTMSDNPAVSSNKLVLKRFMKYRNWGIGGAGLYVYMPLTPALSFFAFDRNVYDLVGRVGMTCSVNERDVIALNQLIYMFCQNIVVLPPRGDANCIVAELKKVSSSKPESTMRINIAVEDEEQELEGSTRYTVVSDEMFAKARRNGIIHVESVPPIVPQHLPKLRIRQKPRFLDTGTGAGLLRYASAASHRYRQG